jgi:(2Fe-2S) ferredoxin
MSNVPSAQSILWARVKHTSCLNKCKSGLLPIRSGLYLAFKNKCNLPLCENVEKCFCALFYLDFTASFFSNKCRSPNFNIRRHMSFCFHTCVDDCTSEFVNEIRFRPKISEMCQFLWKQPWWFLLFLISLIFRVGFGYIYQSSFDVKKSPLKIKFLSESFPEASTPLELHRGSFMIWLTL